MRRAGPSALALALAAAVLLALSAPAGAAEPVEIIDVDVHPRTLHPGENATFEWTVRNLDTIPYNVTFTVEAPAGWGAAVTPPQVTDLAPNRAATVRLAVRAPEGVSAETTATFLVRFAVADGGAVVLVSSKSAEATVPSAFALKRVLGLFDNPLPPPLNTEYGVFLLDVLLWLGIALALRFILGPVLKAFTARTKTQVDDIVLRIVSTPLAVLIFLYGALNSLTALDAHLPPWLINGALVAYAFGSSLIFFYLGYRIFRDVFLHMARNIAKRTSTNIDEVFIPIVEKVGLVVLAFAALGLLLGFLNVDLTLFVAGGVVTSMVIAFAAQDTLSNFFSGIFLLTDRPFKEGDTVVLADGDWVEVRRIGMRTTRLFRFDDAALVTIPNNKLVNEKIANFTNPRDQGRVMMRFNAGYGSDPARVKLLIVEAINACPNIVKQDPYMPIVRFDAMKDSSLEFFVLVWIDKRDNRFAVQDFLNAEVYKRFGAAGVAIPFPQRTVHLVVEGAPGPAPSEATAAKVKARLEGRGRPAPAPPPAGVAPAAARTGEADSGKADRKVELGETVGDLYDALVTPASTVAAGSRLIDAVRALLTVPVTRKVYVVDKGGKPVGTLTLEDLMRNVDVRMGGREGGLGALLCYLREMEAEAVDGVARGPRPVTRKTRLADVAWLIVDEKLNDFPVVDDGGSVVGELNGQRLLEAVLALLEAADGDEPPAAGGA